MKKIKFRAFIPNFRQDYFFSIVLLPTVSVSFVRCREAPEITFLMGWLFWGFEVRGLETAEDLLHGKDVKF